MQKRLYSDFFIIKRNADGLGGMATYYKVKVERLIGLENGEIIHFGQMDADNEVIIKRKVSCIVGVQDDVHIVKSLIISGLLENIRYMMAGLLQMIQLLDRRLFSIVMCKGGLSKWDY